jgi:hypothetical protein
MVRVSIEVAILLLPCLKFSFFFLLLSSEFFRLALFYLFHKNFAHVADFLHISTKLFIFWLLFELCKGSSYPFFHFVDLLWRIKLHLLHPSLYDCFDLFIKLFEFLFYFEVFVFGRFSFSFKLLHYVLHLFDLLSKVDHILEVVLQISEIFEDLFNSFRLYVIFERMAVGHSS